MLRSKSVDTVRESEEATRVKSSLNKMHLNLDLLERKLGKSNFNGTNEFEIRTSLAKNVNLTQRSAIERIGSSSILL